MAKKAISTPKGKAIGPYSMAIETGDLVFVSGQIPIDAATGKLVEGDISAQTKQSMENLSAILAAAGLKFGHVVKTTIFLADMADFAAVNEVYKSYLAEPYPARSTYAVKGLPMNAKVEIEMIASRSAI
jgi:2-iminobutanoate/2-iminopropanoate deaminase